MPELSNVPSPVPRAADEPEAPRRPFVPPVIEEVGTLRALTHQDSFGGPIG